MRTNIFGHNFIADRIRLDNGLTFVNDLLKGLANLLRSSNEFTTAFVGVKWHLEHASKEVLRHLCALALEYRIMDK